MDKEKGTTKDLQNTTQKTRDRATRTLLETGAKLKCTGRITSSCCTSGMSVINFTFAYL